MQGAAPPPGGHNNSALTPLFASAGVAGALFPAATQPALPAALEPAGGSAAADWTKLKTPAFLSARPEAAPLPVPNASSSSSSGSKHASNHKRKRRHKEKEDRDRRKDKKCAHRRRRVVALAVGAVTHSQLRRSKRTDAQKIAAKEHDLAGVLEQRTGAGASGAAPLSSRSVPAVRPGDALYWFDSAPDYANMSFGASNLAAAPRFCRAASQLAGTASPSFGRRRGYQGAGLDTRQEETTGGGASHAEAAPWRAAGGFPHPRHAGLLRRVRPSGTQPWTRGEAAASAFVEVPHLDVDGQAVESNAARVARLGRELHAACCDRPYDVSTWLAFARHQADVAALCVRKRELPSIYGKQVAILERALASHPGSESLLLALLDAAQAAGEAPAGLDARWEAALQAAPGAPRLLRGYVARMATVHGPRAADASSRRALAALGVERDRRVAALHAMPPGSPGFDDVSSAVAQVEDTLVDVAISAVVTDMEAGHEERGVARLQALVEFACFDASSSGAAGGASHPARLRAFGRFWNAQTPRWGEPSAQGWGRWCDEQQAQGFLCSAPPPPPLPGPPAVRPPAVAMTPVGGNADDLLAEADDGAMGGGDGDDASDGAPAENEDDDESDDALLARLGVTLDPEVLTSTVSEELLRTWVATEDERDAAAWRPGPQELPFDAVLDAGLVQLSTEASRQRLCEAAARVLGGASLLCPHGDAASTWLDAVLPHRGARVRWERGDDGRDMFRAAALAQCANRFPRHWGFATASLRAHADTGAAREAAKALLSCHRGSLPLWTALAQREAGAGRVSAARKAFHGALALAGSALAQAAPSHILLAALAAGSEDVRAGRVCGTTADGPVTQAGQQPHLGDIPGLVRAYAAFQAAQPDGDAATALTWLGMGKVPEAQCAAITAADTAAAQQGYQAALCALAAQPACLLVAVGVDVACAAAAFLSLTAGPAAASQALRQCAASARVDGEQAHAGVEALYVEAMRIEREAPRGISPRAMLATCRAALAQCPASSAVASALLALPRGAQHRLRVALDTALDSHPSEQALAAAVQAAGLTSPRARAVLTRACATPALAQLALTWRLRVACDAASGDPGRCRRTLFRAAAAVPGSKAVWLDGVGACTAGALSDVERAQLLEAAQREGCLRLRTDIYELALEAQARAVLTDD